MSRLKNLDCLKALAMFAVLAIHVPPSAAARSTAWQLFDQFCRFAVPCFFMVSGFFFTRSYLKEPTGRRVIVRYMARLLPVFLFWALFYAVVPPLGVDPPYNTPALGERLAYIVRHPKTFALTGDAVQLWFLSALILGIFIVWLGLSARRLPLTLALGTVLYGWVVIRADYPWVLPVPDGFNAAVAAFYPSFCGIFFVACGAAVAVYQWQLRADVAAVVALAGLLCHCAEGWRLQDPAHGVLPTGHPFFLGTVPFSVGLFFLALALPDAGPRWLAWIGTYSLGIYVLHIYLMKVVALLPGGHALSAVPLLYISVLYGLSLLASVALGSAAYTRRLVS